MTCYFLDFHFCFQLSFFSRQKFAMYPSFSLHSQLLLLTSNHFCFDFVFLFNFMVPYFIYSLCPNHFNISFPPWNMLFCTWYMPNLSSYPWKKYNILHMHNYVYVLYFYKCSCCICHFNYFLCIDDVTLFSSSCIIIHDTN